MASLVEVGKPDSQYEVWIVSSIGTDEANRIRLADQAAAPRHAEIRRTPEGKYVLVDLGSPSGTYVWGRRVTSYVLFDGDVITIGQSRFQFVDKTAEENEVQIVGTPKMQFHKYVSLDQASVGAEAVRARRQSNPDARMKAVFDLLKHLTADSDLDTLLARILDTAFNILPAERGVILLLDSNGRPTPRVVRHRHLGEQQGQVLLSRTVINEAITRRWGVISADATNDPRFDSTQSIAVAKLRSLMCVPMFAGDSLVGVLHLDTKDFVGNAFEESDLELFALIANQVAGALKWAIEAQALAKPS